MPARRNEVDIFDRIPAEYREQWQREGWDVFVRDSGGIMEIERDDRSENFDTDEDALRHVILKASMGSKLHLLALWLDGRSALTCWSSLAWIPDELLPEKRWTVVGHYVSSGRPWVEWIEADDAIQAAVKAVKESSVRSNDIVIIDVFRGHHTGAFPAAMIARGNVLLEAHGGKDGDKEEAQEAP